MGRLGRIKTVAALQGAIDHTFSRFGCKPIRRPDLISARVTIDPVRSIVAHRDKLAGRLDPNNNTKRL